MMRETADERALAAVLRRSCSLANKNPRVTGMSRSHIAFLSSSRSNPHPGTHAAGIGTIEYPGCRGFIGPVPLPLWIRVMGYSIVRRVITGRAGIVKSHAAGVSLLRQNVRVNCSGKMSTYFEV
jgi:hypothetical protein